MDKVYVIERQENNKWLPVEEHECGNWLDIICYVTDKYEAWHWRHSHRKECDYYFDSRNRRYRSHPINKS